MYKIAGEITANSASANIMIVWHLKLNVGTKTKTESPKTFHLNLQNVEKLIRLICNHGFIFNNLYII